MLGSSKIHLNRLPRYVNIGFLGEATSSLNPDPLVTCFLPRNKAIRFGLVGFMRDVKLPGGTNNSTWPRGCLLCNLLCNIIQGELAG